MKTIRTVGIVGLGLIGGSMARSVRKHTIAKVYGYDLSPDAMSLAELSGAIDAPLTKENLKECDLLMIAIFPKALVQWVKDHADDISNETISCWSPRRSIFETSAQRRSSRRRSFACSLSSA